PPVRHDEQARCHQANARSAWGARRGEGEVEALFPPDEMELPFRFARGRRLPLEANRIERRLFGGFRGLRTARAWRWRCRGARLLDGQADTAAFPVEPDDFDFDAVADLHHLARIAHEAVGQLADMHQAVLMHADVDERA